MTEPVPSQSQDQHQTDRTIPRSCSVCDKKFFKLDHLQRHLRSHTKEKPFSCEICHRRYGRSQVIHKDSQVLAHSLTSTRDTLLRHYSIHQRATDHRLSTNKTVHLKETPSAATSAAQQEEPPTGILRPLEGFEQGKHVDRDSVNQGGLTLTSASECLAPDIETAAVLQPLDTVTATDQCQNIDHDFYPHTGKPGDEMSDCPVASSPSPSFVFEPDTITWENFDSSDLDWCLLGCSPPADAHGPLLDDPDNTKPPLSGTGLTSTSSSTASVVERSWYTRLEASDATQPSSSYHVPSSPATPGYQDQLHKEINEGYRQSLFQRLRPRWTEEPLPSIEFLKMCVQMYFSRANPALPILHAPTFRPTTSNGGLLLSICSIGCLFLGTSEAAHYGSVLFERLLRAMMVSWDSIQMLHAEETVPMVQLALLGQTFGLLSGEPRHLAIVSAFHGTAISWARRADMFRVDDEKPDLQGLSEAQLIEAWTRWARKEEIKRAALAILIHDAEITALYQHEPFLRHRGNCIPLACPSDAFATANVHTWAQLVGTETVTSSKNIRCGHAGAARPPLLRTHLSTAGCCKSVFTAYAVLQGIGASIREDWIGNGSHHDQRSQAQAQAHHQADLMAWYEIYHQTVQAESDPQLLMALWYWTCLSNHVDLHRLELAVGKQGPVPAAMYASYVRDWASSVDARRCVMHAFLLQKNLEGLHCRRVVAMHVPRALFSAAIVWSTYLDSLAGCPPPPSIIGSEEDGNALDFPEFRLLGVDFTHQWTEGIGFRKTGSLSAVKASTLCTLADMLRRIGYWEISRKFSSILGPLIHAETDANMILS